MVSLSRPTWMRVRSAWTDDRLSGCPPWILELVIVFAILLLIAAATPIGANFGSISPHPFWIPVLLLSSQYGTLPGITAAVVAMALHWLAGAPPPAGGEDIYDYLNRVWREPMLWPVAAVVLGGFRAQQAEKTEALRSRLVERDAKLRAIASQAEELRSHCEALERQIACAPDRSIEAGLAALDEVRRATPERLKGVLPRAVEMLVGPASYLLLTLRDGRLTVNAELSSAPGVGHRLPRPKCLPEILEVELARRRRPLSVRSAEAVDTLAGVALIAAPVHSPVVERLSGALLIQTMDPMRLTEETERNLGVLCRELAHALDADRVSGKRQRAAPNLLSIVAGGASSPP